MEFGIVVPIFLLFVFGLVEIGRGFMISHLITNAARVGCRQGVLPGETTATITDAVNAKLAAQGIQDATTTVTVNGAATDASSAAPNDDLTVVVSVPVAKVTWMPVTRWLKGNIAGQYTLRRE